MEQALKAQPDSARALYVRARVQETQGDTKRAKEDYGFALQQNPGLVPALSRMWRLQQQAGEREDALATLERLSTRARPRWRRRWRSPSLYAETRRQPEQGLKLIAEALKRNRATPSTWTSRRR